MAKKKKAKKRQDFAIPDPSQQLSALMKDKYKVGDIGLNFYEIKIQKPSFAFDFISITGSKKCFNSKLIAAKKDYPRLLDTFKKISVKSYDELLRVLKNSQSFGIPKKSDQNIET